MKVNEIIANLEKAGFKSTKQRMVSLSHEGSWLTGKYLGTQIYVDKTEKDPKKQNKTNQKFLVTDGEAIMGKDSKELSKIEAGEYVVFGSGLLNWILEKQYKTGDEVAVVFKGTESYKENGKAKKRHQFDVIPKEVATK